MRDQAVERAYNFMAQFAASVCHENAYHLELAAVGEDFVKTRVERANLQRSFSDLVSKVRQASVGIGGAL